MGTRSKTESLLPAREVAVCERVREIRLAVKWNQPNFAKAVGITRERLASYEYAKAPIRYELAKQICFRFNVSQRWLADGARPMHDYFETSPHLEHLIGPRSLFTEAYDEVLKAYIENRLETLKDLTTSIDLPRIGTPAREIALFYLNKLMSQHLRAMPDDMKQKYYAAVSDSACAFFQEHLPTLLEWAKHREKQSVEAGATLEGITFVSQETLDNKKPPLETAHVQKQIRTLDALIISLRKLTKPRGAKSALAKEFRVSRQAVDQWLSGDSSPSAEIAIRLLKWVEDRNVK